MKDETWEKIHKERMWGLYPETTIVKYIRKYFPDPKKNKRLQVLDLGCGAGANTWFLAEQGFDVYGIDISPTAIKHAKDTLKKRGVKATLDVAPMEKIPFVGQSFDIVIDCHSLQHAEDVEKAMAEIRRVLKVGGVYFGLLVGADASIEKGWGPVQFFDSKGIQRLFESFSLYRKTYITCHYFNRKIMDNNIETYWVIEAVKN